MKNTWMLQISFNSSMKSALLIELIYYYYYLLKNFDCFNFIINFKNFKFLILNFVTLNLKNLNFYKNLKNFKNLTKFLNFKINYKFNTFNFINFNDDKAVKNFLFLKKSTKIEYKLFNLYFMFNYSLFNSLFKYNNQFKLFYISNFSNKIILIDSTKFVLRWKESYDFFFNMFFFNFNPLIFSNNFFKIETLSLNWNYNFFELNLWKYYFPFFTFKLNNYNKKTDFFFDKLALLNINFFLITDCSYHYKNLYYIKKKKYYSIGLVNVNLNPWIVDYPIINFFDSYVSQIFFFKFLLFIERRSIFIKFNNFKKIWLTFLINIKK